MTRLTRTEFIGKATLLHRNKYDYSNVEYINNSTKIKILCSSHGEFLQTPSDHLGGHGCPRCGGTQRSTTTNFIIGAKKIHGNRYDYSFVKYINAFSPVKILCKQHGYFHQTPNSHLSGCGCFNCNGSIKLDTVEFIRRAIQLHGDKYDYSKTTYTSYHKKLIITCKHHGDFLQRPSVHLRGSGCSVCSKNIKYSHEEFIKLAETIHGKRYNYSKTTYTGNKQKIVIICNKHGEFLQRPTDHLNNQQGCPKCNHSLGENKISKFLTNKNILYETEKSFIDCVNPDANSSKSKLRFDFFIPAKNLLIEYDGKQHFQSGACIKGKHVITSDELKAIQRRDKLKTRYARRKGIHLIRIKYTQFNNIESILEKALK